MAACSAWRRLRPSSRHTGCACTAGRAVSGPAWQAEHAFPASASSLASVFRDTSALRAVERRLMPSTRHLRIRTFLGRGREFIPTIAFCTFVQCKNELSNEGEGYTGLLFMSASLMSEQRVSSNHKSLRNSSTVNPASSAIPPIVKAFTGSFLGMAIMPTPFGMAIQQG